MGCNGVRHLRAPRGLSWLRLLQCGKVFRRCHHGKLRCREILAVSGNDGIDLGFQGCVILQGIFKVLELRGQRVINSALTGRSDTGELAKIRQQIANSLGSMLAKEERDGGISHRRDDELHLLVVGHCEETYSVVAERLAAVKQVDNKK